MGTERAFINELASGSGIEEVFLVGDKQLRTTRGGDYYIDAQLRDRTGSIRARMWQATEAMFRSIPTEGFLHVRGRVEDYRGTPQVIIEGCKPVDPERVDLADFLPATDQDVEAMWSALLEILRQVKDKWLRLLIKEFVEDDEFVAGFRRSPAAKQMHHAHLGGLLEHTLSIARLAEAILPMYPSLNADLLLTSVLLHDAGKIEELQATTSVGYTERGQLVGHITIAAEWIHKKADAVSARQGQPFPARTLDLLEHMVLSHHGSHEFGSPKLPMIPEAFVLHHLDNLDAKVWATTRLIEDDPDPDAPFTPFQRMLGAYLYKKSGKL